MDENEKKQVKKARKKENLERLKELEDTSWVMGSKQGREFVWRILSYCGLYQSSFNQHNGVMSLNEGRRDVGLKLFADINEAQPEQYFQMMREHKEDYVDTSTNTND